MSEILTTSTQSVNGFWSSAIAGTLIRRWPKLLQRWGLNERQMYRNLRRYRSAAF